MCGLSTRELKGVEAPDAKPATKAAAAREDRSSSAR